MKVKIMIKVKDKVKICIRVKIKIHVMIKVNFKQNLFWGQGYDSGHGQSESQIQGQC